MEEFKENTYKERYLKKNNFWKYCKASNRYIFYSDFCWGILYIR